MHACMHEMVHARISGMVLQRHEGIDDYRKFTLSLVQKPEAASAWEHAEAMINSH